MQKSALSLKKRSIINHNSWHSYPSIIHINKIECKINFDFWPKLFVDVFKLFAPVVQSVAHGGQLWVQFIVPAVIPSSTLCPSVTHLSDKPDQA